MAPSTPKLSDALIRGTKRSHRVTLDAFRIHVNLGDRSQQFDHPGYWSAHDSLRNLVFGAARHRLPDEPLDAFTKVDHSDSPPEPLPPAAEGAVDAKALATLINRGRESNSDALVVLRDGKLVGELYFDKPRAPIEAMSVTKSIVSLAVGKLIDSGKLKSLDEPVSNIYPEWRQGKKRAITVRHLLNHTSGIQAERTTKNEIYPSPDFVQLALAAELVSDPGTKFFYNNKAVSILAGIVQKLSGKRLDRFVGDEIFAPMGITDFGWELDQSGNPHSMSGLSIHALDLAKIGQMLLDEGVWQGKTIISKGWIAQSIAPGQQITPSCGLLWWLDYQSMKVTINDQCVDAWRQAKLEDDFMQRVLPMKGKLYERKAFFAELEGRFGGKQGLETWYDHTWRRGLPDGTPVPDGPLLAFRGDGWLGQAIVVVPKTRIVAVRQMRSPPIDQIDESKIDTMKDLTAHVHALAVGP
jgi:CubicO group peptidase (beta-lactamase class C family)